MAERIRQGIVWAGIPVALVTTTLTYSDGLTDYMIPKTAAIYANGSLMLGLLLLRWIADRRIVWSPFRVHVPMVVFGCVSLVSLLLAQNRALSFEILAAQASLLVFCLVVANSVRGVGEIAGILWFVSLLGHAVAFVGLLQYFGIHLIPIPAAYGDHPISTLGNPNFVAHYLCMVIPAVTALLLHHRSIWARLWLSSTFLITSFHLLITRSRAGWAVAALTLLFMLLATRREIRILPLLVKIALIVALVAPGLWLASGEVTLSSGERLSQRFEHIGADAWQRAQSAFDLGDFSIEMRRIIWADSVELIRSRPLLGTGPGNFELHLPNYRSVARHRDWSELMGDRLHIAYRAHNEYLEQAAEIGLVGLTTFLWMLGSLTWAGAAVVRRRSANPARLLGLGCLAAMIGVFAHSLFSFTLQDPTAATLFFLFAGLLLAASRNRESARALRLSPVPRLVLAAVATAVVLVGSYACCSIIMGDHYYLRGLTSYMQDGHGNRAKLAFERAIDWRGYDHKYHRMLGQVELAMGRNESARDALQRSQQLHPNNAPALQLLGESLFRLGQLGASEELTRHLTRLKPLDVEGYRLLALARRGNRKHMEAVDAWKQALSFRRQDPSLVASLGFEYAQAGKLEEALAVLTRAATLRPGDGVVQGNLGGVYLGLGQYSEAKESLTRALIWAPENASQWQANLAHVHLAEGNLVAALDAAEAAIALDPRNERLKKLARTIKVRTAHE
jgi:putative inorganic carbon (HCO3(-)) transporter